MTDTVRDNPERNCFELVTPADTAFASYRRDDTSIMIMHTEVPRALEGRKVVPMCSSVRYFIDTHPDYADLVR